jgi:hypothetical protein
MVFLSSSHLNSTLFLHCLRILTQSLMWTSIGGDQYHVTTFCNVPSLLRCALNLCAASIILLLFSVRTNTFAGGSVVFRLRQTTPSAPRYCVTSCRICCIWFEVFPSFRFRFPRNSPISFHLPLCSSTSLYISIGSYCLSLLFQSDP